MIEKAMLVMPGCFNGGVAAMLDAFELAAERRMRVVQDDRSGDQDMRLAVLSAEGGSIALGRRVNLKVDAPIATTDRFDFVWVPAFRIGDEDSLVERLAAWQAATAWLAQQFRQGAIVGASGSAIALLLEIGIASDIGVPVVPALGPTFRSVFPRLRVEASRDVVERDRLILGAGITSDSEIIARAFDRILSPATGHWLRSVTGRGGEEAGADCGDPLVENARLWLEQHFAQPFSLAALAEELCVSHSVLIRRFKAALGQAPSQYVKELRLATAKRMLSQSNRPIEVIAAAVGYSDPRNFRQMFRAATGVSAKVWRQSNIRPL